MTRATHGPLARVRRGLTELEDDVRTWRAEKMPLDVASVDLHRRLGQLVGLRSPCAAYRSLKAYEEEHTRLRTLLFFGNQQSRGTPPWEVSQ